MWRKRNTCTLVVEIGVATMENSTEGPQKIKTRIPTWSSCSTSGYLPPKPQKTNSKKYMHPYVH